MKDQGQNLNRLMKERQNVSIAHKGTMTITALG